MDIQILLALQGLREILGGAPNAFFAFITTIAVDYWVIIPAFVIFWAFDKKKGRMLLFSAGIGRFLTATLKSIFCVYRPWVRDPAVKPLPEVMSGATGYSFPSGHSASSSSLYAALIVIYRKYKGLYTQKSFYPYTGNCDLLIVYIAKEILDYKVIESNVASFLQKIGGMASDKAD